MEPVAVCVDFKPAYWPAECDPKTHGTWSAGWIDACRKHQRVTVKHATSFFCKIMFETFPEHNWYSNKHLLHCREQKWNLQRTWPTNAAHSLPMLRIRIEARANTVEREQQLQFMQTRVQPVPTEDLHTADTSCPSRTSADHFIWQDRPCWPIQRPKSASLYRVGDHRCLDRIRYIFGSNPLSLTTIPFCSPAMQPLFFPSNALAFARSFNTFSCMLHRTGKLTN